MTDDVSLIEIAKTRRALAVERLTVLRIAPLQGDSDEPEAEPRSAPRRLPPAAISPFTGLGCRKLMEPYRDPRAVFRNGGDEPAPTGYGAAAMGKPGAAVGFHLSALDRGQGALGAEILTDGEEAAEPTRPAPRNRQADMVSMLLQQVR